MRVRKALRLLLLVMIIACFSPIIRGFLPHPHPAHSPVMGRVYPHVYPQAYIQPERHQPPRYLVIDTATKLLTLYVDQKPYRSYQIATGTKETPTPIGDFTIVHKDKGWGTGFGSRWMGLNVPWGIYGIHGTNKPWSIGCPASHGCVRMHNRQVEELYNLVPLHTPVYIVNSKNPYPPLRGRTLRRGMSGQDVVYVQRKLQENGMYWDKADGRYGTMTSLAVAYFQFMSGHRPTGVVDKDTYHLLQLQLYSETRQ